MQLTREIVLSLKLELVFFFGDLSYKNLFSAAQDHLHPGFVIAMLGAKDQ